MKFILFLLLLLVAGYAATIWYNVVISGNYWVTAPWYQTAFMVVVLLIGVYATYRIARYIFKADLKSLFSFLVIVTVAAGMQSCDYAKSNQKVVYSEDCGVNWKEVPAGSRVPTGTGNPCFVKETMPGYEMQGEMDYYVLFQDQVKVKLRVTYSYMIEDALLFMESAKKLGRTSADADEAADDNQRFEGAENRVIETRIKKITSDEFPKVDVVTGDINALELVYVDMINNDIKSRGVKLTVFEMVTDFQPLTQQAIDAANADRIYQAKGMQEFGRQITLARAGANNIVINTPSTSSQSNAGQ